jgi:ribonuclease HI
MVDIPEVYAFFDGACTGNGYSRAKAGYGVVIKLVTDLPGSSSIIGYENGTVSDKLYEFINKDDPIQGIQATTRYCQPSNNRGEYLGFINALLHTLRSFNTIKGRPHVTIVSDSQLCLKTLSEWLPNRRKKGTEGELKNLDLVFITEKLLNMLKEVTTVTLKHVRSHKKAPTDRGNAYLCWKGNDQVDRLATSAVKGVIVGGCVGSMTDAEFDSAIV